jgi:hypothetical protein
VLEGLLVEHGEHHTLLPCAAPASAAFLPGRGEWWSNDPTLARTLQQTEATLGVHRQDWKWYRKKGGVGTYYSAEWSVQIRPLESGAHLVVRGLQGGPFDETNLVGVSFFLRIAWVLQTALHHAPPGAPAAEPYPTVFGDLACALLNDDAAWPTPSNPVDLGDLLRATWGPLVAEEVSVGDVNQKRLKLARAALPPAGVNAPILGVLRNAGILMPTKVVTLTSTHVFIHFKTVRVGIPWSDIVDARPEGSEHHDVLVRSRRFGWIPVPGCRRAPAVAEAFRSIARTVAPAA